MMDATGHFFSFMQIANDLRLPPLFALSIFIDPKYPVRANGYWRTDTAVPFLRNGNLGGARFTRYLPSTV